MLDLVAFFVALLALAVAVWNTHHTRRNSELMHQNTLAAIENTRVTEVNSQVLAENTAAVDSGATS